MLASTVRNASRLARTFATVVDASGFKIAAVDQGQPTSAVTLFVKAGSRFETRPGVAHALKNFAFKVPFLVYAAHRYDVVTWDSVIYSEHELEICARNRPGERVVRRSSLVLSVPRASCSVRRVPPWGRVSSFSFNLPLRLATSHHRAYFIDVLTSFITGAKFTQHELQEYVVPVLEAESAAALADPATRAIEAAHALAFRSGLGTPLAWSASTHPTLHDVKEFARSAFAKGNFAALGTGIGQDTLARLVEKALSPHFASPPSSSSSSSPAAAPPTSASTSYHGGETRIDAHGGAQTVFVGYGVAGASSSPSSSLAILSAHLSPQPSIKWSQGISPISAGVPVGTSVRTVLLPYSDAALFGLLIQGASAEGVREAGKAAVRALKESCAAGGVKGPDLKKAVAKAKFAAASAVDRRDGFFNVLGPKVRLIHALD
jgi:ubiquinol-cytochrome c reductase core subunit 2